MARGEGTGVEVVGDGGVFQAGAEAGRRGGGGGFGWTRDGGERVEARGAAVKAWVHHGGSLDALDGGVVFAASVVVVGGGDGRVVEATEVAECFGIGGGGEAATL